LLPRRHPLLSSNPLFSLRLFLTMSLLLSSSNSWAATRIAVLVTSARGLSDEPLLTHVRQDAERLHETLQMIGGIPPANIHRLDDATPRKVLRKLKALEDELKRNKQGKETLLLVYYSGHADETSLHMNGEKLKYAVLRDRLKNFRAKLKIGIIDACKSGGIIGKGASARASRKVRLDDSLKIDGTVVLTSSSQEEFSLAIPSLESSIFSRHLTSGLRGAADKDADGMVTLDEVFHYAHLNTQAEAASLNAGEQVPQIRNLEFQGAGPIILTWLKRARAHLTLPPGQDICFITNADEKHLIADGRAAPERELHIALKPASYVLKCKLQEGRIRRASFNMATGEHMMATTLTFEELSSEADILLKGGLENLEQRCAFDITAQSLYVERDQRTNVINLEAILELRIRFSADDVTTSHYPSPSTVVTARQGDTLRMNQFVTRVTIDKSGDVPLSAELWEVEFGFQGQDDHGSQRGSMHLDCSHETAVLELSVPISADTLLEKSGSILVRYLATRL
jgi:hypothetical protein